MADEDRVDQGEPEPAMTHVWAWKPILATLVFVVPVLVLTSVVTTGSSLGSFVGTIAFWGLGIVVVLSYVGAAIYRSRYRWELGSDEIRVWKGVIVKKRVTIPLSRVQNVNVKQGPLLMAAGLSTVELETAGHGRGPYSPGPEGTLPGTAEGDRWADLVTERAKTVQDAGL